MNLQENPKFNNPLRRNAPILVIGSTCVDLIIHVDHLPVTEEDIRPMSQTMSLGGCAFNVANILRQTGADFTFVSPVGSGLYGDYVEKKLREKGFPIHVKLPGENGCCYCLVEAGGERTFLSVHGVEYIVPATPATVADTIGAGDSHIGTLLSGLQKGMDLRSAVRWANEIAAAVVSVRGASLSDSSPFNA